MKPRFMGVLASGLVMTGVLGGCASSSGSGGVSSASTLTTTATITVGVGPVADYTQYFVAEQEGYFAKNHLKVKAVTANSGPEGIDAIKSGSIDFTYSATLPTYLADQSGLGLVYVGPGDIESPGYWQYYMAVKSDSTISTLKQVFTTKGTKIGWIGSSTPNAIAVRLLEREMGVSGSDVTFVTLSPPDITTALEAGEVQAAISLEPFTTIALQSKAIKTIGGPLDTIMGNSVPTGGYIASSSWAKAHTGVVTAFNKALTEATQYIDAHSQQTKDIISSALKISASVADAMPPINFVSQLSATDLQTQIDQAVSVGLLTTKLNASDVLNS
jgi:NitT/TauT family transport system substrate-binding protein